MIARVLITIITIQERENVAGSSTRSSGSCSISLKYLSAGMPEICKAGKDIGVMFSDLVTERVHLGLQIGTAEPLIGTEVGWKSGRSRLEGGLTCVVRGKIDGIARGRALDGKVKDFHGILQGFRLGAGRADDGETGRWIGDDDPFTI